MARKFELDSSIAKDIKAVASDSFADSIKMISIENVKPAEDNFFSMSDIEILADDIERQGLKHNLVVSEDKNERGTYWLKSGHRRFAAIKFLLQENRLTNKTVPCFIDGIKTKAENMLDLIMLNATTRVMTDAEIMQQYIILEKTYKELEAEGITFKGRLRERIADALQVSASQVSKIEKVNRCAVDEVKEAVSSGSMSISTANEVAKLSAKEQKELISNNSPEQIKHKDVKQMNDEASDDEHEIQEKVFEKSEKKTENSSKTFSLSYSEINALKLYLPSLVSDLEENDFENYKVILKIISKLK